MPRLLVVALGGALGAMLRHIVSDRLVQKWGGAPAHGTFLVNALGCLAMGLLLGLLQSRPSLSPHVKLFVGTGILGALTTFSTFSSETIALLDGGNPRGALVNIVANLVAGVGGVLLGRALVR